MPKRRRGERDGGRTANRRRRHLYLIFDDWSRGYSIRKVNLEGGGGEQRLPDAFWRVEAERGMPEVFTSAFGARIVALHGARKDKPEDNDRLDAIQIVDVRTRSLVSAPASIFMHRPVCYFPIAGDRLFLLDAWTFKLCRLPQQDAPHHPEPDDDDDDDADDDVGSRIRSLWRHLPLPTLSVGSVTITGLCLMGAINSYAVHSDGRTLLVSTKNKVGDEDGSSEDAWTLPFTGRGHFDRDLDAIVALSKDPDTLGHLYSCHFTNADTGKDLCRPESSEEDNPIDETGNSSSRLCSAPAWKLSKEKVLSEDPAERHVGATLLYMGRRSKFCVVECLAVDDDGVGARHRHHQAPPLLEEEEPPPQGGVVVLPCSRYVYRVVTFSPRYDEMGDLRVKRPRVVWYNVPSKATAEFVRGDPVAFWL
ncbi:hypothetical protein HU200_041605 [Digitaria exilis]|uniref:DUF1618 domain-containing protein n=1 Tax=Digitaria exilis TaxID=1010633 RepID=A0A835B6W0_9POAL|nr:hypothetical protein HU200_041605 [Digitaria exilis]